MKKPHPGGHGYYGYRYNSETHDYEIYPEEAIVIQLIALMMSTGYKLTDIVAALNLLGIKRSSDNSKPIDSKWIRRQFGLYRRYDKDDPSIVLSPYEKYNGSNGFPPILGVEVYRVVARLLNDDAFRRRLNAKEKCVYAKNIIDGEVKFKPIVKDVNHNIPISHTVKIAKKRNK